MLTRWEAYQLLADALVFAEAANQSSSELYKTALEKLKTKYDAFDKALVQERSAAPEGLIAADEARDYGIRKLYALASEYADYQFDAQRTAAAAAVLQVFKPYGKASEIVRLRQDSETAVITNLLQELDKDEIKTYVSLLGLDALIDHIRQNNAIFEQLQQSRRDEQSQYVVGLSKAMRDEALDAFRAFCEAVNALALVEGGDKYAKLIGQLDTLISDYRNKALQRRAKNDASEKNDAAAQNEAK